MSECIAVIQYEILTDSFELRSGDKTLSLPHSKEMDDFVNESPRITEEGAEVIKRLWNIGFNGNEIRDIISQDESS